MKRSTSDLDGSGHVQAADPQLGLELRLRHRADGAGGEEGEGLGDDEAFDVEGAVDDGQNDGGGEAGHGG